MKAGNRYEKDPDRHVQEAIKLVFSTRSRNWAVRDRRSAGSTSTILDLPVKLSSNGDTAWRRPSLLRHPPDH